MSRSPLNGCSIHLPQSTQPKPQRFLHRIRKAFRGAIRADVVPASIKTFQLYSAQTGERWGRVEAIDEGDAIDRYAMARGYKDRADMWKRGHYEYLSAVAI